MELSAVIAGQIASQLIMLLVGLVLVKVKVVKESDSRSLSTIILYVIVPCTIVNSFQIDYTPQILSGLLFAIGIAVAINVFQFLLAGLLAKSIHLNKVEQLSLAYPNVGNIIIPLVLATLGQEYLIYSSAYLLVQTVFLFTYGTSSMSGENQMSLGKIVRNPCILAIVIGFLVFILHIPLPGLVSNVIDGCAAMVAPLSMLAIGMSLGKSKVRHLIGNLRNHIICLIRLVVMPLLVILLLRLFHAADYHSDAGEILLILVMGSASSVASMIAQLAQVYHQDVEQASTLNVLSVLYLIVTMPIMVQVYLFPI